MQALLPLLEGSHSLTALHIIEAVATGVRHGHAQPPPAAVATLISPAAPTAIFTRLAGLIEVPLPHTCLTAHLCLHAMSCCTASLACSSVDFRCLTRGKEDNCHVCMQGVQHDSRVSSAAAQCTAALLPMLLSRPCTGLQVWQIPKPLLAPPVLQCLRRLLVSL